MTNQHQEFDPPEELQDTIKCFWYDRRDVGRSLSGFEVVPDGYAEIIFYFGSLYSMADDGNMQPLRSPFVMGLLDQPAVFYTKGRFEIIGIRCFPWTVFDLLGLASGKGSTALLKHSIARLQSTLDPLMEAGKTEEALNHVKQYFLDAGSQTATDSMLFKAGLAMSKAKGTMPVKQVAAAAHATVRSLERKFKRSSGHTVKDVSALMRFEQARNQLWRDPDYCLAGLAHELGYTDQSHLSREFKRYSGTTPAAFAKKAKQGKRLVSNNFVAFIQA